jgi:hypothetical protein
MFAYLAPRAVLAQRRRFAAIPLPPHDDVGCHVDPHGACTDTGTIPSQNIEAAGDSERGPTKNARYPALARTHSSSDSPLSTPRASDPLPMSVHHDSLRRSAINKRRHPWRVGSSRLLIRSLMKSVDFGARDSGTVENVAWHHRYLSSASTADQELQYRKVFPPRASAEALSVHASRYRSQWDVQTYRTDRHAATVESDRDDRIRGQSDANPNATTLAARWVRETAPILMRTFFR